jgi:integrase
VLNQAKASGASIGLMKNIKSSVNVVFNWAVEERFILGVHSSPTEGLDLGSDIEKVPSILSLEEMRKLLSCAKAEHHPWYHIWAFGFLTGMRSGELKALQFKDIDLEKGSVLISKSLCSRTRKIKCTKAGYWRTVPISSELRQVIEEIRSDGPSGPDDFVLPRHGTWTSGEAAKVLRMYLEKIEIKVPVVFHTLRACFATHLLGLGVDQATVMKMGGWRDMKTFQIYIRLAGIDVKGATDALMILPKLNDLSPRDNVISILDRGLVGQ